MFYVYLLCDERGKLYIGSTGDLERRMTEHTRGGVKSTRHLLNPKLIYYEAYLDKESAQMREQRLKQFGSSYHGLIKRLQLKNNEGV